MNQRKLIGTTQFPSLQKKSEIVFLLLSLMISLGHSQSKLDSLRNIWEDENQPRESRIETLVAYAEEYLNIDPDSTIFYAGKSFEFAKSNKLMAYQIESKNILGKALNMKQEYEKAELAFEEALEFARIDGDSSSVASTLFNLGRNYELRHEFDRGLAYYDQSAEIFEEIGDKYHLASTLNNSGVLSIRTGDIDGADKKWSRSVRLYEEIGNLERLSGPLLNLAILKTRKGDVSGAIQLYAKSLAVNEKTGNDRLQATARYNLATLYIQQGDSLKFFENIKESLEIRKKLGDKKGIARCLGNIGAAFRKYKDYDKALDYFNRSYEISQEVGDKLAMAKNLQDIGSIQLKLGNEKEAIANLNRSLNLETEIGNVTGIGRALGGIGDYYLQTGNPHLAIDYYNRSLEIFKDTNLELSKGVTQELYKAYEMVGETEKAFSTYKFYISARDSLVNQENQRELIRQEYKYEYEKLAVADSIAYVSEKKVQEAKLEKSTNQRYFLFVVLILVAGFSIVLINRVRVINKQKSTIGLQNEELNVLNHSLEEKVEERTRELVEVNDTLKQSEERYKLALEASSDGIFDLDVANDQIEFSPAIYTMLGYAPFEFPESRQEIYKRIYAEDRTGDHQRLHEEFLTNAEESLFTDEYRMQAKDGKVIWVRSKAKVVERDKNGLPRRVVGTHTDITSEKRKTQEILETVLRTEDLERSRISKDIHDGLQQTLTIASLNFRAVKKTISDLNTSVREKFMTGWKHLQESIVESRSVAHSLMPKAIIDFGVISAFENLIDEMDQSMEGTTFQFQHNLIHPKLNIEQFEVTLYRILQEAMNNIVKYAKASMVTIQLIENEDLYTLIIEDDGVGFDTDELKSGKSGMGFKSMKNRLDAINGILDVSSFPGKGTTILVEISKSL